MLDPTDTTGEPGLVRRDCDWLESFVNVHFPEAKRVYGGFTLWEGNGRRLDIMVMMFNIRAVDAEEGNFWEHDRYWCFDKTHPLKALEALRHWVDEDAMAADTEPVGWIKSWDQRYHGEGPVKHRV